ncbi:hypothetical protein [Roseomonas chloroacetimidivorans]|uniref:hypothetical protein n=1 Tax=Roseomonas chloroacetimidivorans TaxID=1766656 RepID=UPI003C7543B3
MSSLDTGPGERVHDALLPAASRPQSAPGMRLDPSPSQQEGRPVTPTTELEIGQRIGRFVFLRDVNGMAHALAATSVAALYEVEGDSLIVLPGGRLVHVPYTLRTVLSWLEMGRS